MAEELQGVCPHVIIANLQQLEKNRDIVLTLSWAQSLVTKTR